MKQKLLEIKNLSVRYKSTKQLVVKDISFTINKGDIVAILGPSGSGKTTILNIISNLIGKKDVEVSGDINFVDTKDALNINTVFQEPRLLPWRNVLRNISYGLEIKNKNIKDTFKKSKDILNMVGLDGFDNYSPSQLSIGMQQRVNFARAVVCRPDLLLMDEPFSALDLETKYKIQKQFLKIISENKITSIFVTHSKDEAFSLSDKIIILSKRPAVISQIIDKKDFEKLKNSVEPISPYEC
jgi:NitT/TauT family transport system ATP-binding protein